MNFRSAFNKVLLLIPVALVAPLLAVASPATTVCTASGASSPTLNANSMVSLAEGSIPELATFTCAGVALNNPVGTTTINDPGTPPVFSDFISWRTIGSGFGAITTITFLSDFGLESPTTIAAEPPVILQGTFFTGPTASSGVTFTLQSDDGTPSATSDTVSASVTPEPGSMLLFGTGLLIAGGFARRRLLAHTHA